MFQVIFRQDVDVTPRQARSLQTAAAKRDDGGMTIGVDPCAEITVGFIWPCGTMRIGGCGTILPKATAFAARVVGGGDAGRAVTLDPTKDAEAIQKLAVLAIAAEKEDDVK